MNSKSFDYKRIAEGYANDRPWLHKQVIEKLWDKYDIIDKCEMGLDIGCGAGLSTKALKLICNNVLGTDISPEMIMVSKIFCSQEGYSFLTCMAEELTVEANTFDIVTAAGVMNWVDESALLPNLYKSLKEKGLVLIYDFWISDKMEDNSAFTDWFYNQYLVEFPKPKRKEFKWTAEIVAPYKFIILEQEEYEKECPMNMEQFIRFILLQSNVIAQVEEKGKDIEFVKSWFYKTLTPIWKRENETLIFDGYSWYIAKNNNLI